MKHRRSSLAVLYIGLVCLGGCATWQIDPEECPEGTQRLEGCPPIGAVADEEIAELYQLRTWVKPSTLDVDPVEFGRDAEIPINSAGAKFIDSTDAGALISLASKIWLIENAEHTIDLVYYIFRDGLSGHAILGALCEAVQRGVDVRIMVDSLGSSTLKKKNLRALESCALDAGFMVNADGRQTIYKARVQPVVFNAVSRIFVNVNRRSHDKLFIVDGHFPEKAAVITGGRNVSNSYFDITDDGAENPQTYRDAELLLRGGENSQDEDVSVGKVSEVYYTLLFLFKNNSRLSMTRLNDPRDAYEDSRNMILDSLARLKSYPRFQEYFEKMPEYVATGFHDADVLLVHELTNLTDRKVVTNAIENAHLNPNSITANLQKAGEMDFGSVQIVSPYMFAALFKDKKGNVLLDGAQNVLDWLDRNPTSTVELITNSVLTSDNYFTQAIIDMDLAPRALLSEELREQWLRKPSESELNPALVESEAWREMVNHTRLFIYETGTLDDVMFGGEITHSKMHAKYTVSDDMGFVGTTNFDYRSRLYNNEMGFIFRSQALADDIRENSEYLKSLSYRWGSPQWLEMRRQLMEMNGRKASTTRKQRTIYKTLRATGLHWQF